MRGGNLGSARNPAWTEEETEALRRHYPEHGPAWEGWAELLPGRSRSAIVQRASVLAVRFADHKDTAWGVGELAVLMEEFPAHGAHWPGWEALFPGRSVAAIRKKAYELGLRSHRPGRVRWEPREDALIEEHYPLKGSAWDRWADLLPGRTERAIRTRASRLGVKVEGSLSPGSE